jgi:hypothetical protein
VRARARAVLDAGSVPPLDTSTVRPEGAILRTFGGLASGPEPLHRLHAFMARFLRGAAGQRLTPLECLDLVCNIGEVVVGGGVRRYTPRTCCACWPLSLCGTAAQICVVTVSAFKMLQECVLLCCMLCRLTPQSDAFSSCAGQR